MEELNLSEMESLTETEKQQLIAVMKRAREFEQQEEKLNLRQPLEGQLYKYTNVMKGWQYRWFTLDPDTGYFEYYEKEEYKKNRPRGSVHLAGAVISPSDEDSQTFTLHAANTEVYRLKAFDTRERQHWVNRLRAVAEYHTENLAQKYPRRESNKSTISPSSDDSYNSNTGGAHNRHINSRPITPPSSSSSSIARSQLKGLSVSNTSLTEPFRPVKEVIKETNECASELSRCIDDLPTSGSLSYPTDKDILLLKATSLAGIHCLEQCLSILQSQYQYHQVQKASLPNAVEWIEPNFTSKRSPVMGRHRRQLSQHSQSSYGTGSSVESVPEPVIVNHDEDVEDAQEYTDTELGAVEEHKSVILHLLSQLKLGMDLTRVVLPTFILEKRSLLEMFADYMAHPDIFLRIPDGPDAETRMMSVLEWYLTSLHAGRKGSVAKKPYNPIIGETFHCSWDVEDRGVATQQQQTDSLATSAQKPTRMTYTAEQVSHHPPISAFYFECPDKRIYMNSSIWTKSKFMGMSIGVCMIGKMSLNLLDHDEEYVFTLPSAYARSILTIPWVELGDKINITCTKSGYSSSITFHTKPFYGGKLHRITAEVKDGKSGNVTCRVNGEWNGAIEFQYSNGEKKVIDTETLPIMKKRCRPIEKQGDFESRKLWQKVSKSLKLGDVNTATEHKKYLEDKQRHGEKYRTDNGISFPTKFFHREENSDTWVYNNTLKQTASLSSST
ncbi:oxysterol-binding protein-related protein 11-like isoform X2 [Tubulanus polymorphus]|uniref:oxysterol-binding protein-related protein 11-like isoform X2 n=1 Tax=Tubulanus polymorphus TaxID=672921 RepID=UPI003DA68732